MKYWERRAKRRGLGKIAGVSRVGIGEGGIEDAWQRPKVKDRFR